jgi:hypothetical protein
MATVNDLLNTAISDLGYCESPANSNRTKYGEWFGLNGQPWCMMAVQYWCNKANVKLPLKTAGCTAFMNAAKKTGQWVTSGYKAGDIILYNFDNRSDADHVGICESATGSSVTCIEGNTSLLSQDNGGKVMRRKRNLYLVLGAYRPNYDTVESTTTTVSLKGASCEVTLDMLSKGSKGNSVKALQTLLIGFGFSCGSCGADGDFGASTQLAVKKFQSAKGLSVDGIVGSNTWSKLLK